jgi:hypothetical protein
MGFGGKAWERQGSRLLAFEGFRFCCLVGFGVVGFFWWVGLWVVFFFWVLCLWELRVYFRGALRFL